MAQSHPDPARGSAGDREPRADIEPVAARSPAGLRLHPGRPQVPDDADGHHRRGSGRLHGQRHADLGDVRPAQAAVHLFQAELRAGHQPADRPDPRRAGDESRLHHRAAAEPARHGRRLHAQAAGSAPADPHQREPREDPLDLGDARRSFQVADARHHLRGRARRRRHGLGGRQIMRARRGRGPQGLQHPDPVGSQGQRRPHSDPGAARLRRRAPSPHPPGPAHRGRAGAGERRAARGTPFRVPGRLRRGSDQPLSRLRDADRHQGRSGAKGRREGSRQALHQGGQQGPAQGDVQDGHLHLPVLLRRADFRRGRPAPGIRRPVFHRHPYPNRGRGAGRDRGRDRAPPPRGLLRRADLQGHARRRRRLRRARARRGPRVDRRDGVAAAARGARQFAGPLPRLRGGGERAERAAAHHPRPVPHQVGGGRPPQAGAARGSRAGQEHRAPLLHRRHVVRLDLARGAHHAGHRHEPHRRQVEHRRGRRGSRPLQADAERRLDALGDQAGGFRPLRRHGGISRQFRHDADQDGARGQARRRRPVARPQGRQDDRQGAPFDAGRRPDLAAAAPRHLFDRGPGAAHLRPEERQPGRRRVGEARLRGRRRHRRRRRLQGARRPRHHRRLRGRHRRKPPHLDQARRFARGRSASPKPTRRWSATACAGASRCRSTAACAPAATW